MSDRADRILDLIDTGLQHSHEPAMPLAPAGRCTRCQHHPADVDSDFCDGCRAFLLGDSDQDPTQRAQQPGSLYSISVHVDVDEIQRAWRRAARTNRWGRL